MFAYKTNSADYLDYVAASISREELLNDPDLCFLLENPYIRDNMEVAFAWHAAKFGDYEDKYNFVEYYLCNGPELDADTLLHYRALAQADPVVMEIAYSYFTDTSVLSEIRESKYGKKKNGDWTDCFKNPCFYLGDFSPVMGSMGDSKNVDTYFNVVSEQLSSYFSLDKRISLRQKELRAMGRNKEADELEKEKSAEGQAATIAEKKKAEEEAAKKKEEEEAKKNRGKKAKKKKKPQDALPGSAKVEPSENGLDANSGRTGNAPGSENLSSNVRPSYWEGWAKIGYAMFKNDVEFAQGLAEKAKWSSPIKMGDWMGRNVAKSIDLLDKANVARMLGDCFRMWSQVRNFRVYSSDNQYTPITSDQLVKNRNADGTTRFGFKNSHPTPADATRGINPSFVEQAKRIVASGLFKTHTNSPSSSVTSSGYNNSAATAATGTGQGTGQGTGSNQSGTGTGTSQGQGQGTGTGTGQGTGGSGEK